MESDRLLPLGSKLSPLKGKGRLPHEVSSFQYGFCNCVTALTCLQLAGVEPSGAIMGGFRVLMVVIQSVSKVDLQL
jgi:hypothetical protein